MQAKAYAGLANDCQPSKIALEIQKDIASMMGEQGAGVLSQSLNKAISAGVIDKNDATKMLASLPQDRSYDEQRADAAKNKILKYASMGSLFELGGVPVNKAAAADVYKPHHSR